MVDYSESIVREAPEIEAYKLGLLKSGKTLADTALRLPEQRIAGFSGAEREAFARSNQAGGIGGYQALASTGRGTLGSGLGTMGQALGALGTAPGYIGQSSGAVGQAGRTIQGSYDPYVGAPVYSAQQFGGAPAYSAQGFDPSSATSFFNPYEDVAVQQALGDIRRQGDIAANQQAANAVQAGAFGGSREGIQRAELDRTVLEQQARTAAGMRQAGYDNALQQAQASFENQQRRSQAESQFGTQVGQQSFEDAQRRSQAQSQFGTQTGQQAFEDAQRRSQAQSQFGTQTQLAAAQQQQGLASLYGNLASAQGDIASQYGNIGQAQGNLGAQQLAAAQQAQSQGLSGLQALMTTGNMQRQQQQAALDAAQGNAQRQMYEPYTRLAFLNDLYKGAPSSTSSIGNQVAPAPLTPSLFQQIGGIGTGLLGAAQASKTLF